ncbi:major head protein [Ralstonia phage AhaGv]|nr:major head protein [Ralstonia phage AhaGv]
MVAAAASSDNAHDMSADQLAAKLRDPMWRICNLYKIMIKGDDGSDDLVIQFKPNRAQRRLLSRLFYRNIILKARQLGFTTLIAILWLDHALFNENSRCGIIAQDREAAEVLFRDKVKFGYDNLPPALKEAMPLLNCTKSEMLFAHNNSSIRVATSMRSGTIHRLHISEFGKICAKYPDKAKEVMTGSIPAVPKTGILVIESTAEGQQGEFFELCQDARHKKEAGKILSQRDYRFHFYPWWDEPNYRLDVAGVIMTDHDRKYFAEIESKIGRTLDMEQRAWYVATRDADFKNNPERMWQEYPSTPDEAFQKSTEGCYFATQLARARLDRRICRVPFVEGVPVNTFWDIGNSDGTAVWFHQRIGPENRFIKFIEGWGETYSHFVREMQALGWIWGKHYLPHDASHERMREDEDSSKSPSESLARLGLRNIEIVPRIPEKQFAIQAARDVFGTCWFDEEGCKEGIAHLEGYKRKWNKQTGSWGSEPVKEDGNSEAADAFMQFAQGYTPAAAQSGNRKPKPRNWRVA